MKSHGKILLMFSLHELLRADFYWRNCSQSCNLHATFIPKLQRITLFVNKIFRVNRRLIYECPNYLFISNCNLFWYKTMSEWLMNVLLWRSCKSSIAHTFTSNPHIIINIHSNKHILFISIKLCFLDFGVKRKVKISM